MWSILRKGLINYGEITCSTIKETKRFAGHSKWANIKHIKAEKDGERATLFAKLTRQMRVAITEEGSCKPSDNVRLARVIEVAKKKSMPAATINAVLDKAAKSTAKTQTTKLDIRGPGGCVMVMEIITDNMPGTKMLISSIIKKYNSSVVDRAARHVFHHKGSVITKMKDSLDLATEDAITVGAEDVEEIEQDGEKCFEFTCEPEAMAKVANQLASRKYEIISTQEKFTPHIHANLNDTDISKAEILFTKLEALDEVVKIHDNIA